MNTKDPPTPQERFLAEIRYLLADARYVRECPDKWPLTVPSMALHIADLHRRIETIASNAWFQDWEQKQPLPF